MIFFISLNIVNCIIMLMTILCHSAARILDTSSSAPVWDISVPRQIGTRKIRQIGTCVFFFYFTYKTSNSLEPIPNFNHVCSGKDPDHADNTVTLYTYIYNCRLTLWNWKKFFCPIHFIMFLGFYSKFSQYGLHTL